MLHALVATVALAAQPVESKLGFGAKPVEEESNMKLEGQGAMQVISTTYDMARASGGVFNGSGLIKGFSPASAGPHPLFIWFPGTGMNGTYPIDQWMANQMAIRGYVAVAVEYPAFRNYSQFDAKAATVAGSSKFSALSIMCADTRVNCSAGVAVAGYSQGTHIATLSSKHSNKISASYSIEGARPTVGNFTICDSVNIDKYLPKTKRRYNTGEGDEYFAWVAGSHNYTPTKQNAIHNLRLASGYDCGAETPSCLQSDGSGYYVPTRQVTGGVDPDHYTWVQWKIRSGDCVSSWFENALVWGLSSSLDWLARAAAM